MGEQRRLSPYATPSATQAVLERHGLFTKYSLGQNFLVNDDVVRKILDLADLRESDSVLEVGPGIGTLTAALLQRVGHVAAVEMDRDLPAVLADTLAPWAERFTLVQMDALELTAEALVLAESMSGEVGCDGELPCRGGQEPSAVRRVEPRRQVNVDGLVAAGGPRSPLWGNREEGRLPGESASGLSLGIAAAPGQVMPGQGSLPEGHLPNKLVSNLPYAVAATVVLDFLQRFEFLESATVMVQKEVADRMMAKPGTKAYGAYTVKLSLYAEPRGRFPVSPGSFFPPPRVESAVIRLDRASARDDAGRVLTSGELRAACQMADAAFATRRKTLANSCKAFFADAPGVQARLPGIFAAAGIDPRRRGETLTKAEFIRLGLALNV